MLLKTIYTDERNIIKVRVNADLTFVNREQKNNMIIKFKSFVEKYIITYGITNLAYDGEGSLIINYADFDFVNHCDLIDAFEESELLKLFN